MYARSKKKSLWLLVAGKPTIGVLALQGAFAKHTTILHHIGVTPVEVRRAEQLELCDGLILPGGESTTIRKQLEFYDFLSELPRFAKERPLFGTCAGLILMAREIEEEGKGFGLLDISVARNSYGRQTDSFRAEIELPTGHPYCATFIRAPRVTRWGRNVKVLASHNGDPIWIQEGHHMAATFHPELTDDSAIHEQFVELVTDQKNLLADF